MYQFPIRDRRLRLASIVSVRRPGFLHEALVSGFTYYGEAIVSSISSSEGSYEELLADMLAGQPLEDIRNPDVLPDWLVLQRAAEVACRPYNWVSWNCQHFVRYAHGLKVRSPGVETIGLLALGAAAIAVVASAK